MTRADDRMLGLHVPIARRDFLNGSLVGVGAALLGDRSPLELLGASQSAADYTGYPGIGDYARSNGNTWAVVEAGHQLRDGRFAGTLPNVRQTGERYDLVVVGAGFSGLGAAHYFQKLHGGRCLVLDNHPMWGGEAKRNEFLVDGVRLVGPQGSNGFAVPSVNRGWSAELWKAIGLPMEDDAYAYEPWAPGVAPLEIPKDNYMYQDPIAFSAHGYFVPDDTGGLRMVRDPFGSGFAAMPWPDRMKRDFTRMLSLTERPYRGDDWERWLDSMTYERYLVRELGLDPAIPRYLDPVLASGMGLGCDVLSAYAAFQVRSPGTEPFGGSARYRTLESIARIITSFPGGNDGIARHLVKALVPQAIAGGASMGEVINGAVRFGALDQPSSATRVRLAATVVRVEPPVATGSTAPIRVTYLHEGRLAAVEAARVVMANGGWSTLRIVRELPEEYRQAYAEMVRAPMLVANVALRDWRFMYELGITAASYRDRFGFTCNVRQPMVIGGFRQPLDPAKPIVLTFYVPFVTPGKTLREQAVLGRTTLLNTSYREYERQIRDQLVRLFGRSGFEPRRHIAAITLNRWGHAYVCAAPGFFFARNGKPAPPDVVRRPLGRIAFANGELHGHQNWRDAVGEGKRAAEQLVGG